MDLKQLDRLMTDVDGIARSLKGAVDLVSDGANAEMHEAFNEFRDLEMSERTMYNLAGALRIVSVAAMLGADKLDKCAAIVRRLAEASSGEP